MSHKSQTFLAPHLRTTHQRLTYERPAPKSPSYAPAPYQVPASLSAPRSKATAQDMVQAVKRGPGRPRKHPVQGLSGSEIQQPSRGLVAPAIAIQVSLTETVALVSAALQAADVALTNSQKWESLNRPEQREQALARAVMLEALAERLAKAARNAP